MNVKRLLSLLLAAAMLVALASCGGDTGGRDKDDSSRKESSRKDKDDRKDRDDRDDDEDSSRGGLNLGDLLGLGGDSSGGSTSGNSSGAAGSNPSGGSSAGGSDPYGSDYSSLPMVTLVAAASSGYDSATQLFGETIAKKVDAITGGQLTIDKVLNGNSAFRSQLDDAFNDNSLQLLGIFQNGTYRQTTSNKYLASPADFSGLLIRTLSNSNYMDFWTAIGAQAVTLSLGEVYSALANGLIDAQANYVENCVSFNLNEVQSYLACTNHILYAEMVIMNQYAWNNLDPLYQQALQQAVSEALAEVAPELTKRDRDNRNKLINGGMSIIEYDNSFYDQVLALPGVVDLYREIDSQTGGLGAILQADLRSAAR